MNSANQTLFNFFCLCIGLALLGAMLRLTLSMIPRWIRIVAFLLIGLAALSHVKPSPTAPTASPTSTEPVSE